MIYYNQKAGDRKGARNEQIESDSFRRGFNRQP